MMRILATNDLIHAVVVVIVVISTVTMALYGTVNGEQAIAVMTGALGYAAGRSGTREPRRSNDTS
jgi:hypothetical protein